MQTRFIQEVGTRACLVAIWEGCPVGRGRLGHPFHRAEAILATVPEVGASGFVGDVRDYQLVPFEVPCEHCGAIPPPNTDRSLAYRTLYDSPSGKPEPGDMYLTDHMHDDGHCFYWGTACQQPHLIIVLPNGIHWDVDSRASNCTMPTENAHRCWVRHGEPPAVTVDKDGPSCAAGSGSIQAGDYHGFLRNGVLT